jgi:hypothetical protein
MGMGGARRHRVYDGCDLAQRFLRRASKNEPQSLKSANSALPCLEKRLAKEKDPEKRAKLEKKIEERRQSKAFRQYGEQVEKYVK